MSQMSYSMYDNEDPEIEDPEISIQSNTDLPQDEGKQATVSSHIASCLFEDTVYQDADSYIHSKWEPRNNVHDMGLNYSFTLLSNDRDRQIRSWWIQWVVVALVIGFIPAIARIYMLIVTSRDVRVQPFYLYWGNFCGLTQDISILAMGLLVMFIVDTAHDAVAEYKPISYLLRSFISRLFFRIFRAILFGVAFFISTAWCILDLTLYINMGKQRVIKGYIQMFAKLARTGMDSLDAELVEIPLNLSSPAVMFALYTISVIAFVFLALFWLRLVQCLSYKGRVICAFRLGSFVVVALLIAMITTYWMGPIIVHQDLDSGTYQLLAQVTGFYWVPNAILAIKLLPEEMTSRNLFGPTEIYTQENIDTSKYPLFRKTTDFKGEKIIDMPGLQSGKKYNVLILSLESFKACDMGVLDPHKKFTRSPSPTPNLDSLSKKGVLYRNFFSNGMQTSRTIPSIFFGSLPMLDSTPMTTRTYMTMTGLPQAMKEMGYHTRFQSAVDVNWDNWDNFLLAHGFDQVLGRGYYNQRLDELNITERPASSWGLHDEVSFTVLAEDLIALHRNSTPFFSVGYTISSHHPFVNPSSYVEPQLSLGKYVNMRDKRKVMSTSYMDAQVGVFMDRLKAEGILDDTIVILVGDHGFSVGEHTTELMDNDALHNELVNVPFILIAPGMDTKHHGTIIEKAASHVDIMPTIIDMIGMPEGGFWQHGIGRSLLRHDDSETVVINSPYSVSFMAVVKNKTEKFVFSGAEESSYTDLSVDPTENFNTISTISPEKVAVIKRWGWGLVNLFTNLYHTDSLMPKSFKY